MRAAAGLVQTVLDAFTHPVQTGAFPCCLIAGAGGVLYGTTFNGGTHNGGTVFALTPPPAGKKQWIETILYSFGGGPNTSNPVSLTADSSGALYGEVGEAIFKLTPPTPGSPGWTESVLYQFQGTAVEGGVLIDPKGNLFGVTETSQSAPYGTVFEVRPPASGNGPWTEKTLYAFTGGADGRFPVSALSRDAKGALYGTTYQGGGSSNCNASGGVGCGVVFRLTPPANGKTAWTQSVLFAFDGTDGEVPAGQLLLIGGAVYGTTDDVANFGTGEIYELTPPKSGNGPWNQTILYTFPSAAVPNGLFADGKGNFYGLTEFGGNPSCNLGCGTVFKLSPPVPPQTTWMQTTLFFFNGGSSGHYPGNLFLAGNGVFYGTAPQGGASANGTVYTLKR